MTASTWVRAVRNLAKRASSASLLAATLAACVVSDGGSFFSHAPMGPVSSHPPLPLGISQARIERLLVQGGARRALGALAHQLVADPSDVDIAVVLLDAAQRSGRVDWLGHFATAASRRRTSAAYQFLLTETEYVNSGYAAGIDRARAAHLASPDDQDIGFSYAAALAASGRPAAAYSMIDRWTRDPADWASMSEITLRRLATLLGTVAPETLGKTATNYWLRRGWISDDSSSRTRALAFASSLARASGDAESAALLARESMALAEVASNPASAAVSIMNGADSSRHGQDLVMRSGSACLGLPRSADASRADCLLSALESAFAQGKLNLSLKTYESLQTTSLTNPLLALRVGTVAVPLLEIIGRSRDAARLAERGAEAAAALGNSELASTFLLRVADARRFSGDRSGAAGAAAIARRGQAMEVVELEGNGENTAWGSTAGERAVGTVEIAAESAPWRPDQATPRSILAAARIAMGHEENGRRPEAMRGYRRAIEMFESMRATASMDSRERSALNDVWQDAARRAIDLALADGDLQIGVELLERSRSRQDAHGLAPRWPDAFPPATTVVAYAFGHQRVWAVAGTEKHVALFDIPLSPGSLRSKAILWRELAKSNGNRSVREALEEDLAGALLGALAESGMLTESDMIVVVPDDVLHLLPFAPIVSRYIGGKRREAPLVVQAPSLAYLRNAWSSPARAGPLVGFAMGGGTGTIKEMELVLGAGGEVHIGSHATESVWRRQAARASIVHFGGHAIETGDGDDTMMLELTADGLSDGALTLSELEQLDLRGATVVLLACDTATRPTEPGSAGYFSHVPSIGEVLMHAGARAVVGNLWPITEEDAQVLAAEFYRAGGPNRGAAALEEARGVLRNRYPDTPRRWAGAVWLGAADDTAFVPAAAGR